VPLAHSLLQMSLESLNASQPPELLLLLNVIPKECGVTEVPPLLLTVHGVTKTALSVQHLLLIVESTIHQPVPSDVGEEKLTVQLQLVFTQLPLATCIP